MGLECGEVGTAVCCSASCLRRRAGAAKGISAGQAGRAECERVQVEESSRCAGVGQGTVLVVLPQPAAHASRCAAAVPSAAPDSLRSPIASPAPPSREGPAPAGRVLGGLPESALRRIDPRRTIALAAATSTRVTALPSVLFERETPMAAIEQARAGWTVHQFPGYRHGVALETDQGWGYQPSGDALTARWRRFPVGRRRALLRTMLVEKSMAFPSLRVWAETLLGLGSAALSEGVWQIVADRLDDAEFEAISFLYGLSGEVYLPARI